jgi:hypothetical protein
MKMRLSTPAATREAWPTVGRLAAGAVLLAFAVSACTAGGSSVPSTFTPSPLTSSGSATQQGTATPSPSGGQTSTAGAHASTSGPASGRSTTTAKASVSASVSVSVSVSASASATRASSSPAPSSSATPAHSATPSATQATVPQYPTAAPETGGGGTAGLQDGLLFGLGGASVVAGLGFLALRRRLSRRFAPGGPASRHPVDHDPADREPAER